MGPRRGPRLHASVASAQEPGRGAKRPAQREGRHAWASAPPTPDCVASRPREGHAAEGTPSASMARGREALSKRYADPPLVSERPLSAAARLSPFRLAKCGGRRREGPGSPARPPRTAERSFKHGDATRETLMERPGARNGFLSLLGKGRSLRRAGHWGAGLRRGTRELHPHRPGIHPREKQAEFFPPRETLGASSCGRRWGRHLLTRPFHVSWVVEPGREAAYGETRTRGRGEGRTEGWKRGVPPGGAARTSRPARNLPLEWPLSFSDFC